MSIGEWRYIGHLMCINQITTVRLMQAYCEPSLYRVVRAKITVLLPLDDAIASRAAFVIVSGADGRAETLLEPAK